MSLAKWSSIAAAYFLTAEQTPLTVNPLGGVLSVLWPTVLLVLIMYLAYKSTQLIRKSYDSGVNIAGRIEVLERQVIGPDKYLLVVRIGGEVLLLGVTSGGVSRLARLDAELYGDAPSMQGGGFNALLKYACGKGLSGISGEKGNNQ